jgi:hypothetical protein
MWWLERTRSKTIQNRQLWAFDPPGNYDKMPGFKEAAPYSVNFEP